ncbi:hypothetical protein, conserved [Leishmania tarentolae]|uniref:Transmembrane protein n=1 Tax=Leishmania tarentolae TaxID=5689 RepID=A0A640K899_LEITA|nr:hypothetical protein, conserved [Leishmania tarentolae]
MEHSVSSRSPSGQWYPQQQQQPNFHRNSPQQQQQQLQWSPVSGTVPPMMMMGGSTYTAVPPSTGATMLGGSGMFSSGSANLCGPPHLHTGMTPQQQMMIMQSMYTPQSQCCAPCCGTQECSLCPRPGEPLDPFCCTPRRPDEEPRWWESVYLYFDWTFFLACVMCVLTIVGFVLIMVTKSQDNIFSTFGVQNATDLDTAMQPYIRWMNVNATTLSDGKATNSKGLSQESLSSRSVSAGETAADTTTEYAMESTVSQLKVSQPATFAQASRCTERRLFGSFGELCMENNMNANMFAVQLSAWNNARDTIWILAMVYSILTVLYAVLINVRRHAASANREGARGSAFVMPSITPQQQEEFMKMSPQQQQAFIQEFQQHVAAVQPPPPAVGCCGSSDRGIEFYETPFYEFVRFAWLFTGLTTFAWVCNLLFSLFSFSHFYINETTGLLNTFWTTYVRKMTITLIVVTVFLAWPLCNFVLEFVVMVALVLPWLVIRSTWKRGIEMYRPALPPSQLPAYIRADMFFMDFQDLKRLGFSRLAWIMLTDAETPFFDGCEDPTVDRDPAMTQLMQQRMQWQQMMASMLPPWMQQQQMSLMSPGGAGMLMPEQVAPQQRQLDFNGGTPLPANSPVQSPAQYPAEDGEHRSHKRRRHRSTRDRRHADPLGGASTEQASAGLGATGKENSTRHRHRRHSHHRSHSRSRSRGVFDGGVPQPPVSDAAVENSAGHVADGGSRRHHRRSHSRSHSRALGGEDPSALPIAAPPSTGDAGQSGGAAAAAAADLNALMQL